MSFVEYVVQNAYFTYETTEMWQNVFIKPIAKLGHNDSFSLPAKYYFSYNNNNHNNFKNHFYGHIL